jgi:two-component system, NarL family, sensor kinase
MQDNYQEILIMIIVVALVFTLLIGIVVFIILFYQKKKFQHRQQMNAVQQQFKESLLQTKLEIQEQTFRNISQEIHDNIGQVLSLVKLNIRTIDLNRAHEASVKLGESLTLMTKVIRDLRDLSKTLNPDFINDIGLAGAIEQQLALLQKTELFQTRLTVSGTVSKMEAHRELVIFRVVQELLNNIIKHAGECEICIDMQYLDEQLLIVVQDNGKGFDYNNLPGNDKGQGLLNIINRIKLIGGKASYTSALHKGTTTSIEIPGAYL